MTTIEQRPLYQTVSVGQEVIFVISNNTIVANQTNVRFIADVYISNFTPTLPTSTTTATATFKTTPNSAGVGIFDFSQVVENYVSADNMAAIKSSYKGAVAPFHPTNWEASYPMHLIDKYSRNVYSMRWLTIQFKTQYTNASGEVVTVTPQLSKDYRIFNSYLKINDVLDLIGDNFGYNFIDYEKFTTTSNKFLTNAPKTQYANLNDYGTIAFLGTNMNLKYIRLKFYNSVGGVIGSEDVERTNVNGASTSIQGISNNLYFFGCFPGNLQNWSTAFNNLISPTDSISGGYIEVSALNASYATVSETYTINVNCPDTKGFESIRLCWLNQWGAWDYYTFTKRSTRSISTQGSTYEQLEGTWNDSSYKINSYKGGKKSFRVNATEKISMNTDFVSEDENTMFEELINSPEVYILEGYQDDATNSALNQYVKPVRLTTSSFTKKTIANDKLIQYTFEVEKSKTLRTQSI